MKNWRDYIVTSQRQARKRARVEPEDSVVIVGQSETCDQPGGTEQGDSVVSVICSKDSTLSVSSSTDSPPQILTPNYKPTKLQNPEAPVQPGWLVAYRDKDYRLRGGCDEREHGTVEACEWNGHTWTVILTNGDQLPLVRIVSVGEMVEGRLVAAWTTRDCGYNGEGKSSGII